MSHSSAKSHAEKHKGVQSVQLSTPPLQELESEDIIPGRLTQAQWMELLIQEDAEDIVGEIIDELLSNVMEGCFKMYIEKQLAAFSASWAKSYLTQVLQQQLSCPDEGESPEEAFEIEDPEPAPAISDAWAQGCVPVVTATPLPHTGLQQETDIVQFPAQTEPGVDQECTAIAQTNSFPKESEKERSHKRPFINKDCRGLSPRPPPKSDRNKRQFTSTPKLVPGKLLPSLSCSAERKDVEIDCKTRADSVYNHLSGPLYQPKGYQLIPKIDPSSLPRRSVFPHYEIVDDSNNCTKSEKPSGHFKLELKYKKQQGEPARTSMKPLTGSKDQPTQFQRRNEADVFLKKWVPSRHRSMPSGSLRLDTMVLTKGVTLLDAEATEINSLRFSSPSQSTKLRPIRGIAAVPLFSVDRITSGSPPQVIPHFQSKN